MVSRIKLPGRGLELAMIIYQRILGLLFLSTMALVVWGGVVHNTGSSLACPDWPLCFGQVMPKMVGQVAIEHSHRLLGAFVGFGAIILSLLSFRMRAKHPKLFKFSLILLAVIIFQGVLGGITVILRLSPLVSTAHLATSQIVIALMVYLLSLTLKNTQPSFSSTNKAEAQKILSGLRWAAIILYFQMCLGAFIRHGGQSVACGLGPDSLWLCQDGISPLGTLFPATLEANVHMLHRFMALVTLLAVAFGTRPFLHWARKNKVWKARLLVMSSHLLLTIQIILGLATVYSGISFEMVTAHLFVGMLAWINIWSQNLLARRYMKSLNPLPSTYHPKFSKQTCDSLSEQA